MAPEDQHQVGRDGRQEIHDSVEAEDIGPGFPDGDDPKDIFNGEDDGNDPLRHIEYLEVFHIQGVNAFQHYQCDTQNDNR